MTLYYNITVWCYTLLHLGIIHTMTISYVLTGHVDVQYNYLTSINTCLSVCNGINDVMSCTRLGENTSDDCDIICRESFANC